MANASNGAVKSATRMFRRQRTTALALIPLAFFLIALVIALELADYETARHYLGNPIATILLVVLVIAAVAHMRIGMHEVIEDYVQARFLHLLAALGNNLFCLVVLLASLFAAAKLLIGF
jgi:succinate dehydrogenase / fumarate reductase membrane anchor subunit